MDELPQGIIMFCLLVTLQKLSSLKKRILFLSHIIVMVYVPIRRATILHNHSGPRLLASLPSSTRGFQSHLECQMGSEVEQIMVIHVCWRELSPRATHDHKGGWEFSLVIHLGRGGDWILEDN